MMLAEMLKMTAERHARDYICTKENSMVLTKWESCERTTRNPKSTVFPQKREVVDTIKMWSQWAIKLEMGKALKNREREEKCETP
jgi:hypothetical protein